MNTSPKDYAPVLSVAEGRNLRKQRERIINNALLLGAGMAIGVVVTGLAMQWYFCVCPGVGQ